MLGLEWANRKILVDYHPDGFVLTMKADDSIWNERRAGCSMGVIIAIEKHYAKLLTKSVDGQRWNIWVQPQGTIREMSIAEILIDTDDYKSQAKIQWSKERIAASLGVAESIQEKSKTKEFITGIESELAATKAQYLARRRACQEHYG